MPLSKRILDAKDDISCWFPAFGQNIIPTKEELPLNFVTFPFLKRQRSNAL